ncbi:MAG TPA: glycoside hydrolase family 3 N-terminal domain-containing protein [Terriglobia bacterium]|nr:glycoside hydrolase family 3 N-terminal domain-containing protein [Terriglobia bacterium]
MKRLQLLVGMMLGLQLAHSGAGGTRMKDTEINVKVEELLAKMTLEEKVGQMTQASEANQQNKALVRQGKIGSFLGITGARDSNDLQEIAIRESRLKIPLILGFDVIHGYKTIFPIPLGEASSWDPDMATRNARIAAKEARAAGIHWTFAPMVDIARDARWGRIAEGAGEDPFLGSAMAAARVKGFQGENIADADSVVACAKHYVAYGAAEAGRDYNTVDLSEKTLREVYLPPFKAAALAGVGTFMSAFNDLNGIPATANNFTLSTILRGEWKFKGFVVSDWGSIRELINHGVAANPAEAGEKAVRAGVDMDMVGQIYPEVLAGLVKSGKVQQKIIDDATRRILRVKFQLGLFEQPLVDVNRESSVVLAKEHLDAALEAARRSIVLLKNEGEVLPLRKDLKYLALIGPLADDREASLGCWSGKGRPEDVISVSQGIKAKLGSGTHVFEAKGCDVNSDSTTGIAEAVEVARKSEAVVMVLGESADMSGEAGSRAYLDLPGKQNELLRAVYEAGTPVVLVLLNGRPLTISWAAEHIPAILETWHLGVRMGPAVADVLFGDYNPGGKLPVSFPRTVGQVPIYYSHMNTGRPPTEDRFTSRYLDVPVTPLYPFGYGLSYTKFRYSNLQLSTRSIGPGQSLKVTAEVENVGKRVGDEIVQLYIRDLVGSSSRPVKELKGFQRIAIAAGEKKQVEFALRLEDLSFFHGPDKEFSAEPGEFKVWIGPNSAEGLEGSFEIRSK